MRFARVVFLIAGIWGLLVLTPLYFAFDIIGQKDPPAITHPSFYFGFVIVAIAWQIAFLFIARDPVRLRPLMVPAMIEKFGYVTTLVVLALQSRVRGSEAVVVAADLLLGILFVVAYLKTSDTAVRPEQ